MVGLVRDYTVLCITCLIFAENFIMYNSKLNNEKKLNNRTILNFWFCTLDNLAQTFSAEMIWTITSIQ